MFFVITQEKHLSPSPLVTRTVVLSDVHEEIRCVLRENYGTPLLAMEIMAGAGYDILNQSENLLVLRALRDLVEAGIITPYDVLWGEGEPCYLSPAYVSSTARELTVMRNYEAYDGVR